jgi:hypothetical protein
MLDPQHLQSVWFTVLAVRPERTAPVGSRPAAPGSEPRPLLRRLLGFLSRRPAIPEAGPRKAPGGCPSCCPAPGRC